MPTVNLKKQWFGPDGARYRPADNPHTFPADWKLPSTAEEAEVPEEPKATKKAKATDE